MELENVSSLEEFLVLGFSDIPQLKAPLFVSFLLIYLATLVGNLLIMSMVYSTSQLHTPMYFFLTHLSFIDISCTTLIFPNMLAHFFQEGTLFSLKECLLQIYYLGFMTATEFLLLTVMAYDRYVAICNPLRYMAIMNQSTCIRLATGTWIVGAMNPILHTVLLSRLSFCASHTINHFFCDVTSLMKLSCSSTHAIETLTYIIGTLFVMMSFILIATSYVHIIASILKIRSTAGRHKAFSTCASHLTVVILFNGSLCSNYMRPTSTYSMKESKIFSLVNIAITPLCNPLIYTLKNKDFRHAIERKLQQHRYSSKLLLNVQGG